MFGKTLPARSAPPINGAVLAGLLDPEPRRREFVPPAPAGDGAGRGVHLAQALNVGTPQRRGIFGRTRLNEAPPRQSEVEQASSAPVALPGPISGFGGGTFNLDGSQATPVVPAPAQPNTVGGGMPGDTGRQAGPLGHSMRQPFDYDAALAALTGEKPKIKDWQRIVAGLADGMMAYSGGTPWATRALLAKQNDYAERSRKAAETLLNWRHQDWARQNAADLQAANPFTIGRDRLAYDPATGQVQTIYDGPEDFELYAAELGLEPGTEDYFKAVEDFVLRSAGPSAHARDLELDDHRTENDRDLEGYRYGNRVSLENLRQRNRVGMEGVRQDNRLEVRRTPSAGRSGATSRTRPTATDAKGNKVEWNGTAWVPVR